MWLSVIGWKPGLVYKIVDLSIKVKNVIRIMTTFSKKKKKKKMNVIAKTYLQDFNFERYFS